MNWDQRTSLYMTEKAKVNDKKLMRFHAMYTFSGPLDYYYPNINTAFLPDECRRPLGFGPVWCPLAAASPSHVRFHVPEFWSVVAVRWLEELMLFLRGPFFPSCWNSRDSKLLLHASGRKPTGSKVRIKILVASRIWDYMSWGFKLVKPGNSHFPVGRKKTPANETSVKGQQK